jgi:negative regulator of sigma-B (phosphoserine phosphatase)
VKVAAEFVTVPRAGETQNGDAALVRRHADGSVLIAVLDALGHGPLAAKAAAVGMGFLAAAPAEKGVRALVEGLHDQLRGTRGAAGMLLVLKDDKLSGCGVGNVTLRAIRGRIPATLTPGVLGGILTLSRLRLFEADLALGDRFVLFSDGISSRFDDEASRRAPALAICQAIMERHRKPHDDATVLVTDIEAS